MAKDTKVSKSHKSSDQPTANSKANTNTTAGTPIETYKGDPDAQRSTEIGDIEEETLDPQAPFNKTYGARQSPEE